MENSPPLNLERVVLEVFGGCNYSCQMCPQATGRERSFKRKMPLHLFENILNEICEHSKPIINLEGSGEATMASDLHKYVQACTDRGLQSYLFTNGLLMAGDHMKRIIDAGLSFVRFSVIGYDANTYQKWMNSSSFNTVRDNIIATKEYIEETGSTCEVSSYHLLLDHHSSVSIEQDIDLYRENVIDYCGTTGYIWMMHNWSGNQEAHYERQGQRKSCGRPFANELTIRAGGLGGHNAAVTPCCQTMGPPNESKSVLGHLDAESITDVWHGEKYQELRKAHKEQRFDDIEYCKGCDFLIDDPEVLVWSNDPDFEVKNILGTDIDLTKGVD